MKFDVRILAVYLLISIELAEPDSCTDDSNCKATNRNVCNGHGVCECGVCQCQELYSGPTCEECPTCPAPCELFKDCVKCKVFGNGPLSVMDCIEQCEYFANYVPMDSKEFDDLGSFESGKYSCNYFNEDLCTESFKIGNMSQGYRNIHVFTKANCTKPVPTYPSIVDETTRQKSQERTMTANHETVGENANKASTGIRIALEYNRDGQVSDLSGTVLESSVSGSDGSLISGSFSVRVVSFAFLLSTGLITEAAKD